MKYEFLVESYETERVTVLSVWSEFKDEDLPVRPRRQYEKTGNPSRDRRQLVGGSDDVL